MSIIVRSKAEALQLKLDNPHAFISICDPGDIADLQITPATLGVLRLNFDDTVSSKSWVEAGWSDLYNRGPVMFTDDHALQILDFYNSMKEKAEVLVVHCHAGMSRSAGVASFLAKLSGLDSTPFSIPPKYPLRLITTTLRNMYYARTGQLVY